MSVGIGLLVTGLIIFLGALIVHDKQRHVGEHLIAEVYKDGSCLLLRGGGLFIATGILWVLAAAGAVSGWGVAFLVAGLIFLGYALKIWRSPGKMLGTEQELKRSYVAGSAIVGGVLCIAFSFFA